MAKKEKKGWLLFRPKHAKKQAEKKPAREKHAKKEARKPVRPEKSPRPAGPEPPKTAHISHKTKKVLHNLYFTRKTDEKEGETPIRDSAASIKENATLREVSKGQASYEKRLADLEVQTQRKIEDLQRSMLTVKEIVEELRKENDELRKDRQFFVEKAKSSMNESFGGQIEAAEATVTEQKEGSGRAYADHGSQRKVQTSMDALLDLVINKGSIKLSAAAKKLGVKSSEVEEWAHVLEEHDLIEVHYPTIGSPTLKKKSR